MTMIIMFISYVVERLEQATLETVDRYADRHLAHRFERLAGPGGEVVAVLRQNPEGLIRTAEQLVHGQATAFTKALAEADRQRLEAEHKAHDRLGAALEAALDKTLDAHSRRLAALEKQTTAQSAVLVDKMAALAATVRDSVQEQ